MHIYICMKVLCRVLCGFAQTTLCIGACHKAAANMADIRGDNAHDVVGCK